MIDHFSDDAPEAGVSIIRAVANDLHERGLPRWADVDLSEAALCVQDGRKIITGHIGDVSVAAMVFSDHDPEFWPDIPKGESTYIHKLAVLLSYQGKGLAQGMLNHAARPSIAAGTPVTRLDCAADRPKLCSVYEQAGYSRVAEKMV